ncbi:Chorismate synthase [hydrothermal vent metagenome]|uniref:chorismate synthase n=1 Tax=hydrothermal vent metagenome TaxID=652676 RepID=A0A3B1D463_9ZZZZ
MTTFGESHGPAIGVIIDGVPPNLALSEQDIQFDLDRRKPGQSRVTTQRKEDDKVEILSGVFEGKTTGTALSLLIRNKDQRSKDYSNIKDVFRPGHADYTYFKKYGNRDYRGGGRSSARETAARVAAGAVAKKILGQHDINIVAYTLAVGDVYAQKLDYSVIEKNMVRAPDLEAADRMVKKIDEARKNCDSIGGIIEAVVHGCPVGLGEPVFDRLNARLAYAVMTINAIRGVEFGEGFKAATMKGSEHNDQFFMDGEKIRTRTNHAGGILGGISTGENIILRVAIKPTSSIAQSQHTVSKDMKDADIETTGRHDPCICPRVVPVIEAMIAVTLVDALMLNNAIKNV